LTNVFKDRPALVLFVSILTISSIGTGWWFLTKTTSFPSETNLDISDQSVPVVPETTTESSSSKTPEPSTSKPFVSESEKSSSEPEPEPESKTESQPETEEEVIPRMSHAEVIQQAYEDLNKEKKRINKGDILQVEGYVRAPHVWGDWRRVDVELSPQVILYYDSQYEFVYLMCRFEKPFNETELKSLQENEKVIIQGTYDGYYYWSKLGNAVHIFDCSIIYRGEILRETPESIRIHVQK
jgi:hypothetical protein